MQPPSSRHVSFSKRVRVKKTLSIGDYTREETESTWYASEELEDMALDVQLTVQMIDRGEILDETFHCIRGIESKMPPDKDMTRSNRRGAKKAVFQTQSKQRKNETRDEEELASVYREYCYGSRITAHAMGLSDERFVSGNKEKKSAKVKIADEATDDHRASGLRSRQNSEISQIVRQIACSAA